MRVYLGNGKKFRDNLDSKELTNIHIDQRDLKFCLNGLLVAHNIKKCLKNTFHDLGSWKKREKVYFGNGKGFRKNENIFGLKGIK